LIVLRHIVDAREWNAHNLLNHGSNRGVGDDVLRCWAEGLNWLISRNLVARDTPNQSTAQAIFVTRLGYRVLETGIATVRAVGLAKVRSQFLLGEYELAAFAAMREVEIRVRELAGADYSLLGVSLMRRSFGKGGPLADPELDPGEQVGLMDLFAGSIATFKNPASHRQVDYTDPTEASEVVLLADLLMRLLDRVPARQFERGEAKG
jgi:uncharacterized protein (TIGR02391 family)